MHLHYLLLLVQLQKVQLQVYVPNLYICMYILELVCVQLLGRQCKSYCISYICILHVHIHVHVYNACMSQVHTCFLQPQASRPWRLHNIAVGQTSIYHYTPKNIKFNMTALSQTRYVHLMIYTAKLIIPIVCITRSLIPRPDSQLFNIAC